MSSGPNRIALAEATLKGAKKGKSTFDDYAKKVTGDINRNTTGKENLGGKKK